MPKKHTPAYQNTKPQRTSHASLASRPRPSSQDGQSGPLTVNGRLAQLRASQRSAIKTPPSLDPAFSTISSDPTADQRTFVQDVRTAGRYAGPAPPRSWIDYRLVGRGLAASQHAPQRSQEEDDDNPLYHAPPIMPGQPLPEPRSLRAMAIRMLARTFNKWKSRKPDPIYNLTTRMKAELIAVMALSPPSISRKINQNKLEYLFQPIQDEDGSWASGGEGVTHLSLGPVIRTRFDYALLIELLIRTSPTETEEIPDSWDEAVSTNVDIELSAPVHPSEPEETEPDSGNDSNSSIVEFPWLPFFPSLTHLSLAQPASPCWSSLLEVGTFDCLSHLTHLDLSYWPAPSLQFLTHEDRITPLQTEIGPQNTIGVDEKERIRLINRLGKACRTLTWLGLEGCESWTSCLTAVYERPMVRSRSRYDMEDISQADEHIRVDWTGVWRGLKAVKVIQSWVPLQFVDPGLPQDSEGRGTASNGRSHNEWWETERRLRDMENVVASWRLEAGQSPVKFEKTPVQPWLEVDIRGLDAAQAAAQHWRRNQQGNGTEAAS